MPTLVLLGARARDHEPGSNHPDTPWRIDAIARALAGCEQAATSSCSRLATRAELLLAHEASYVDHVISLRGANARLDEETSLGPESVAAAENAVGTVLELVERLLRAEQVGFAIVRPPGHHATRSAGMGYCVFNNAALGALWARELGARRVALVDWDVHHGNGSEDILARYPEILFVSVHQRGLYPPHSGGESWQAAGPINIPLDPGATDADYAEVFATLVVPRIREQGPDLILVSAGFDACEGDPEGQMRLSPTGFGELARQLGEVARQTNSRVGFVLEGGYDLNTLGDCVIACVRGASGASLEPIDG
jgi:acetoin utilization deacetylase AcuC-like enzyme